MRWWIPTVFVLSGCNGVLGLVHVSVPPPDAEPADAAPDAPVLPQPIAYFNFNGNRKNQIAGDDATCLQNCPTYTAIGARGMAVVFGSTTDCLSYQRIPQATSFTVAMWAYQITNTSYSFVAVPYQSDLGSENSWALESDSNPSYTFRFRTTGGVITAPGALVQGQWHHYAVTYDGTTKVLYVDGVSTVTMVQPGISYDGLPFMLIGCDRDNAAYTHQLSGAIDELYIWDKVLDADRIAFLYSL